MTSSKASPYSSSVVRDPIECNITWILQRVTPEVRVNFSINRAKKSCHTPRRNEDVKDALRMMFDFSSWSNRVHSYFSDLMSKQQNNAFDMSAINIKTIFNPVVPLFEERDAVPAIEV